MYSRSDSTTLTYPQERFACTRRTEPEVFTFEQIPLQATAVRSYVPIRPKKRCTRVMYPAKVRMHLPPPEKSQAKRWLLILCLVVLWQIYTEDPCTDTPLSAADGSARDYQAFPFQSAEEEVRHLRSGTELPSGCEEASRDSVLSSPACLKAARDSESSRSFEQSAGKSMVALLVYHGLGKDK
ncbi:radiation-inducible immediate-early gene IEX-1 [Kryptolebias marmoratus]|uniref:Radiation-inducible immediate-early gene IEX-1 n=1 Tax=Kryptolebias marmoratus TaxID=37003 RepID=A0A3Q3ARY3_KRYMA|nr:radiation-inducible immediate-early gene IEX-1 [Kryptolebias marmoratus]